MVLVLYSIVFLGILDHLMANHLNPIPERYGRGLWQKIDDMVLSPIQTQYLYTPFNVGKNAYIDVTLRWPDGIVPYEFTSDFNENHKKLIKDVLKDAYNETCIQFRPRNKTDVHYIRIKNDRGCWSYVGKIHFKQNMSLNIKYCLNRRTIAHEFLHALGLFHQHSAHDRDGYIKIAWENVDPDHKSNFKKYEPNRVTSFGKPYDFDSIMHYDETAFSINHKPTIVAKKRNVKFGLSDTLSKTDIFKVNKMYNCKMR